MNSKIMLLLALSLASSTITINAMNKQQKRATKHQRRAAAAQAAATRQNAQHEVNCNGHCWKCDPLGRAEQGKYDRS